MAAQLVDLTYPILEPGSSYLNCDAGHGNVDAEGALVLGVLKAVRR